MPMMPSGGGMVGSDHLRLMEFERNQKELAREMAGVRDAVSKMSINRADFTAQTEEEAKPAVLSSPMAIDEEPEFSFVPQPHPPAIGFAAQPFVPMRSNPFTPAPTRKLDFSVQVLDDDDNAMVIRSNNKEMGTSPINFDAPQVQSPMLIDTPKPVTQVPPLPPVTQIPGYMQSFIMNKVTKKTTPQKEVLQLLPPVDYGGDKFEAPSNFEQPPLLPSVTDDTTKAITTYYSDEVKKRRDDFDKILMKRKASERTPLKEEPKYQLEVEPEIQAISNELILKESDDRKKLRPEEVPLPETPIGKSELTKEDLIQEELELYNNLKTKGFFNPSTKKSYGAIPRPDSIDKAVREERMDSLRKYAKEAGIDEEVSEELYGKALKILFKNRQQTPVPDLNYLTFEQLKSLGKFYGMPARQLKSTESIKKYLLNIKAQKQRYSKISKAPSPMKISKTKRARKESSS
jgi:hypothetical protein